MNRKAVISYNGKHEMYIVNFLIDNEEIDSREFVSIDEANLILEDWLEYLEPLPNSED